MDVGKVTWIWANPVIWVFVATHLFLPPIQGTVLRRTWLDHIICQHWSLATLVVYQTPVYTYNYNCTCNEMAKSKPSFSQLNKNRTILQYCQAIKSPLPIFM